MRIGTLTRRQGITRHSYRAQAPVSTLHVHNSNTSHFCIETDPQRTKRCRSHFFAFEVGKSQLKAFSGAVSALADVGRELELVVFTQDDGEPAVSLLAKDDGDTVFGTCIFERRFFSRVAVDATLTVATPFAGKLVAKALFRARRAAARSHAGRAADGRSPPAERAGAGVASLIIKHDEPAGAGSDDDAEDDRTAPRIVVETRHDDGSRRRWRLFYDSSEGQTNTFEVNAADVGEITAQPPQFAELLAHCAANGEVTFTPTPAAEVQCRTDGGRDDDDVVSELSIQAADFEQYVLPDGARGDSRDAIAFQARQPKALVKWCDAADVFAVNFYFGRLPKPVCLMAHAPAGANLRIVASTHVPPREARAPARAARRRRRPRGRRRAATRTPTRGWRRRACTASGSIRRTSRRRSPDMCGRVCKKAEATERTRPLNESHPRCHLRGAADARGGRAGRAGRLAGFSLKAVSCHLVCRRTSRGTQPRLPRRTQTHEHTMGAGSSVDMATAGLDLPDGGPPPPGADAEFDALVEAEMRKRSSGRSLE